jgi:putative hydrolase of the HAD superfamily
VIKAVVFDLDDTLISEKKYVFNIFRMISYEISKKVSVESNKLHDLMKKLFEEDSMYVFDRLIKKIPVIKNFYTVDKLISMYRECYPEIDVYDDVYETMAYLYQRKIKLGIITDGYFNTQSHKIDKLNNKELISQVIINDENNKKAWKPAIYSFNEICVRLNVKPNELIYVGDNPQKDFYVGKSLNIITVRIIRDDSIKKNLPYYLDIKEKYCIHSLSELKILTEI